MHDSKGIFLPSGTEPSLVLEDLTDIYSFSNVG